MNKEEKEELINAIMNAMGSVICNYDKKEEPEEEEVKEPIKGCPCCECDEEHFENTLRYNSSETDKEVTFIVDVAGVNKEDIKVEYKRHMIRVTTKEYPEDPNAFETMFDNTNACTIIELPKDMFDTNKITTTYNNGLLIITCPKAKDYFVREIKIQ